MLDEKRIINIFKKISEIEDFRIEKNINFLKKFILKNHLTDKLEEFYRLNEETILLDKIAIDDEFLNIVYKILQTELTFTESIIKYLNNEKYILEKTKKDTAYIKDNLINFEHINSNILLELLFSDTDSNKIYEYSFIEKYNMNIYSNKIEVDIYNQNDFLSEITKEYDLEQEFLKIKLPKQEFINFVEFNPTYKTYDEYFISIETDSKTNESIYFNKKISTNNVININKKCYSIIVKGPNIKNIVNNIKVNVSSVNNSISFLRKAYGVFSVKNKLNTDFTLFFRKSEYRLFLIPVNYEIDSNKSLDELKLEFFSFKELQPNIKTSYSFNDYNILLYIESKNKSFNLPKIVFVNN